MRSAAVVLPHKLQLYNPTAGQCLYAYFFNTNILKSKFLDLGKEMAK